MMEPATVQKLHRHNLLSLWGMKRVITIRAGRYEG